MTEIEAPRAEEAVAPDAAPATFGRRLAAERERLGLSIDDVAARLRLHPRQVKAIENEALPALPAPFLRGFVRNYAKELRIDPAPLVAELSARLGPQADVRARAETGAGAPRLAAADFASRRVVVGGVLAALIALAVLGWLATRSDSRRDEPSPGKVGGQPAPAVAPAALTAETSKVEAAVAQPGGAPVVGSPVTLDAVATKVPMDNVTPAATAPSATPFAGLRLIFRDQSWVEVTQADGRIVHSQINAGGSEQRIEGKAPLRVVIGNAPAVSVDYKGKPVDLKPTTGGDNVARLTLD